MRTPAEVRQAQKRLGLLPTGSVDNDLHSAVRTFQRDRGLLVDGDLNESTMRALEATVRDGLVPAWFGQPTQSVVVALILGASDKDTVRRYQSARGLPVTGVVDEATAVAMGD